MSWDFIRDLDFHPLANAFPFIEGDDHERLTEDIALHGLHEPIIMLDGMILDGRNRYNALLKLGFAKEQWFETFEDYCNRTGTNADPAQFVVSRNIHRRHLSASQRALAAASIANLRQGARRDLAKGEDAPDKDANLQKVEAQTSIKEAAAMLNVSPRSVANAKKVQDKAAPELTEAVREGKVHVSAAADLTSLSVDEQADLIKQMDSKAFGRVAKELRDKKTAEKKAKRQQREAALGQKQMALPSKKYGVILADPEWRFEPYSRETGMDRAADNHYPTSDLETIKARDVASIAADDCVLFLWATRPMLPQALEVMAAWGFTHQTDFTWEKIRPGKQRGPGYWATDEHEHLLIGTRGHPPCPAQGTQARSIQKAKVGKHSEKPVVFHQIIESYFPNLPKIELNARVARPGWDVWGKEAPAPSADDQDNLPAPHPKPRKLSKAEKGLLEKDKAANAMYRPVPKGQKTVKDLLPPHTAIKHTANGKSQDLVVLKVNGPYGGHGYETYSIAAISATRFDPNKNHRANNWMTGWVAINGKILPIDPTIDAEIEIVAGEPGTGDSPVAARKKAVKP
ncbi:MT-A70 family methyltransferase [Maritalea myrionectae]|uniref:MT-A70 family methyltransferase n=1 Tax=Maritalea myrionectae TaxID=454601 RepID=UPI0003FEE7FA|nr:MT-A70 family methyltransferase [Maritalea myrionectae]